MLSRSKICHNDSQLVISAKRTARDAFEGFKAEQQPESYINAMESYPGSAHLLLHAMYVYTASVWTTEGFNN